MRDKRLWILPGGILLVSAAFLLLNFRVAVSNTQTIQRIMVTELEGNYPDRLQRPPSWSGSWRRRNWRMCSQGVSSYAEQWCDLWSVLRHSFLKIHFMSP
jgi:hypothetical protein